MLSTLVKDKGKQENPPSDLGLSVRHVHVLASVVTRIHGERLAAWLSVPGYHLGVR